MLLEAKLLFQIENYPIYIFFLISINSSLNVGKIIVLINPHTVTVSPGETTKYQNTQLNSRTFKRIFISPFFFLSLATKYLKDES